MDGVTRDRESRPLLMQVKRAADLSLISEHPDSVSCHAGPNSEVMREPLGSNWKILRTEDHWISI